MLVKEGGIEWSFILADRKPWQRQYVLIPSRVFKGLFLVVFVFIL